MEETDCCDKLCDDYCCDEDDDDCCACCNCCCRRLPGCGPDDTPAAGCAPGGWCVRRDCCGVWCCCISIGVIIITDATVVNCVIIPWFNWSLIGWLHLFVFELIVFLGFASHLKCMTTCPGVVPKDQVTQEEYDEVRRQRNTGRGTPAICRACHSYKLRGVHHCSTCNRCVDRMDHHCPWVNNCVGKYNQKFFILFLFYVALGESYALLLFLSRGGYCLYDPAACGMDQPSNKYSRNTNETADSARMVVSVLVGFISALFLAFVCSIGCEQWEAIRDDMPYIDKLKIKNKHAKQSDYDTDKDRGVWEGMQVVFGEEFCWRWLLPINGGTLVPPPAVVSSSKPTCADKHEDKDKDKAA